MRWWPNIASLIVSRQAQIFSVLISKKSLSGHDEKTDDLRDRCCYHAARSLVAATSRRTLWLFTKEGRVGITASGCDACVIGEHFPRPARNGKQNKRRARSSRISLRVALVWSI